MMHTMASQVNSTSESVINIESCQRAILNQIKNLLDGQNALKQEIFILKNRQYLNKTHTVNASTQSSTDTISPQLEVDRIISAPPARPKHVAPYVHQEPENRGALFVGDHGSIF